MKARDHVILGGIAAAGLFPWIGRHAIIFWLASVFIDIDHYIDYVYYNGFRNYSIKNMFKFHDLLATWWKRPEFLAIQIFHLIEVQMLIGIIGLWLNSQIFIMIFMGMIFHIILDTIYLYSFRVIYIRVYSLIEYIIRIRNMHRLGLYPRTMFVEAANHILCNDTE